MVDGKTVLKRKIENKHKLFGVRYCCIVNVCRISGENCIFCEKSKSFFWVKKKKHFNFVKKSDWKNHSKYSQVDQNFHHYQRQSQTAIQ